MQGIKHLLEETFSQSSECASGDEECNSQKPAEKSPPRVRQKFQRIPKPTKCVFVRKKFPLKYIRGTRWRLFCPTSWISASENPNEFSLRIRQTYMILVSWKIVISICSQWYEERSFDIPFKLTPQLEFFRVKIRKTEKFIFSKNLHWNSSSGLKEHTFDNSAKKFSLPKVPENFTWIPKNNYYITVLWKKTSCVPLWTEKAGLRTRVFQRLSEKFSLNISKKITSLLTIRWKTCYLELIPWTRRMLFWQPFRYFLSKVRSFLMMFRKKIKFGFFSRNKNFCSKNFLDRWYKIFLNTANAHLTEFWEHLVQVSRKKLRIFFFFLSKSFSRHAEECFDKTGETFLALRRLYVGKQHTTTLFSERLLYFSYFLACTGRVRFWQQCLDDLSIN